MWADALIIFKKELKNQFKDKRAVIMSYVFPLVFLPLIFVLISNVTEGRADTQRESSYNIIVENNSDPTFSALLNGVLNLAENNADETLRVVFPEGYVPGNPAVVTIVYNSTRGASQYAASRIEFAINSYERNLFLSEAQEAGLDVSRADSLNTIREDTAPPETQGTDFLVTMLPYFILIYLFAGSMSVALDTTAGEKERGSLAVLLVNQVSRASIALGKVMYVVTSALISATSSFLGMVIAFSFFMGDSFSSGTFDPATLVTFNKMSVLLLTLLFIGGVAASLMVLLGSFAKNMKEGGAYVMPVYVLAVLLGVWSMGLEVQASSPLWFVPILNGVIMIKSIILAQFTAWHVIVTVGLNALAIAVLVVLIAKLFRSENILKTT
jgi:sodium transport system permease protein